MAVAVWDSKMSFRSIDTPWLMFYQFLSRLFPRSMSDDKPPTHQNIGTQSTRNNHDRANEPPPLLCNNNNINFPPILHQQSPTDYNGNNWTNLGPEHNLLIDTNNNNINNTNNNNNNNNNSNNSSNGELLYVPPLAPPPYSIIDQHSPVRYPSVPPYYDGVVPTSSTHHSDGHAHVDRGCQTHLQGGSLGTRGLGIGLEDAAKDDLDLFRHTAPYKKIATCVAMCLAILTFFILILLLIYGKL